MREHCPKCRFAMSQCLQEKDGGGGIVCLLIFYLFYRLNCVCLFDKLVPNFSVGPISPCNGKV